MDSKVLEKEKRFRIAAHKVFNTPEGKEVLETLVDSYLINMSVKAETNATYFELGKADVIRQLKFLAESDPKLFEESVNPTVIEE